VCVSLRVCVCVFMNVLRSVPGAGDAKMEVRGRIRVRVRARLCVRACVHL